MGCQRNVAQAILDKKADDVLALKGNQGSLHEDVVLFAQSPPRQRADGQITEHRSVEGGHGRIETRITTVFHDVTWMHERHAWPGLRSLVKVERLREVGARIEQETCYYLSSLTLPAQELGTIVRGHWAVENSLDWVLDMVFRDDECRVRTAHAPANFTTIKHMALNLLRRPSDKLSIRARRKVAAWDDDFLAKLLSA